MKALLYEKAHFNEVLAINTEMLPLYPPEDEITLRLCFLSSSDLYKPHSQARYAPDVLEHLQ